MWARRGKLPPPLPFARSKRWDAERFEAWLAEQQEGPDRAAKSH
jgi:hypothetical protein